jgi:Carboxypeptidase regulatory-like domain
MAPRFRLLATSQALAAGLVLVLWPIPIPAQQGTAAIIGRLVDRQSREPVRGAAVALLGVRKDLASDSAGQFTHEGLASGTYVMQVRAIGYSAASWIVELGVGEVRAEVFELERLAYTLDPVTVERRPNFAEARMQEFERRRASGRGHFITETEIQQANPRSLADLFRNVPGVRMQCRGSMGGCTVRMARAPRECKPDFVVDGFAATNATSFDMPTIGIIGIEIYRTLSETPLQFLRADNQCGTIVIWTRSGPR